MLLYIIILLIYFYIVKIKIILHKCKYNYIRFLFICQIFNYNLSIKYFYILGWIIRNRIIENNDGIVAITSIPFINKNKIEKNKSNGIMLIKDSRPKITNNLI